MLQIIFRKIFRFTMDALETITFIGSIYIVIISPQKQIFGKEVS